MGRSAPSYILARNRRLCLRFRVPLDLVAQLGRSEIVRALGTADPRAARVIAARLVLRLETLWDMMRRRPDLGAAELQELARAWLEAEIDREWAMFDAGEFGGGMLEGTATRDEARALSARLFHADAWQTEHALLDTPPEEVGRVMAAEARALIASAGFTGTAGDIARLSKLLLDASISLQVSKQAWVDGDPGHRPDILTASSDAVPATTALPGDTSAAGDQGRTLGDAIKIYVADLRQRKASAKQVREALSDFRVLTDALGEERRMGSVTARDAGGVHEALRAVPSKFSSRWPGLGLFAAAERARRERLEPLHPRTVNSYLTRFRGLFEQERSAGQIAANPFAGMQAKGAGKQPRQERTFEPSEIELLFACPLFQGCRNNNRRYDPGAFLVGDWMFWAPLIAFFTGARVGEIAQLRPGDVLAQEGRAVISISAELRLKNQSAVRQIPIHGRLIDLGLLQLAERRRAQGVLTLLPDVPKPVAGDPGKQLSKWMSEKLLPRLELKTRQGLGFHSFRHTLKTLLRNAQVPDSVSNNICGHDQRTAGVGARYGRTELEAMATALAAISVPEAIKRIPSRP